MCQGYISATLTAMASARVTVTCRVLGQAVGMAAAIAVKQGLTPRGVYESEIRQLQLLEDDCYLPGKIKDKNPLMAQVILSSVESTSWNRKSSPSGEYADKQKDIGDKRNSYADMGCTGSQNL